VSLRLVPLCQVFNDKSLLVSNPSSDAIYGLPPPPGTGQDILLPDAWQGSDGSAVMGFSP